MSRSYLFVPGDIPRMLQNIEVFEADAIIIDFEDSVRSDKKEEARSLTQSFLTQFSFDKPDIYIRINDAFDDENFMKDLKTIAQLPLKGIVLPKVSVQSLTILDEAYQKNHFHFPVLGLVETPSAFLELKEIASHPLIKGLILGAEDLMSNLGIQRIKGDQNLLFAKSMVIFAAKAFQKEAIDTPCVNLEDETVLIEDINRAVELGFTAKTAIHPNHVEPINQYFYPDNQSLLEAKKIIEQSNKLSSVRFALDGKMIDKPIIERAKALLNKAALYKPKGTNHE